MTLPHVLGLAAAGAVGTLLRAGCNAVAVRWCGTSFPWGTLVVNVVGSLVFGLIVGLVRARGGLPTGSDTILLVGLLGGFTTFSSFAHQALEMTHHGRPALALAYVVATNVLAVGAVWAGLHLTGPSA